MRLLVIEDEQKVANFIKQGLEEEGYAVDHAADGASGLQMALEGVAPAPRWFLLKLREQQCLKAGPVTRYYLSQGHWVRSS